MAWSALIPIIMSLAGSYIGSKTAKKPKGLDETNQMIQQMLTQRVARRKQYEPTQEALLRIASQMLPVHQRRQLPMNSGGPQPRPWQPGDPFARPDLLQ